MRDCLYISLLMLHFSADFIKWPLNMGSTCPKNVHPSFAKVIHTAPVTMVCWTNRTFCVVVRTFLCCNLLKEQKRKVTGYTGGSVLLPCSCDDPKSTINTFTWEIYTGNQWINVFKYEKDRDRLKLFNKTSPANLSLLISDIREEDNRYFRCMIGPTFTDVFLTVKGCHLDRQGQTVVVTGYLGESVVLPCSCTEPLAKPDQLKWSFNKEKHISKYEEIYPSEHIERYKNRHELLNQTTPGNLSLHLSSLTKEDQGDYICSVSSNKYIFIRLHVEEKPQVHTIYSSTYQPSQQTHELITIQQPENTLTHHTPQHVVILMAVFASVLLMALLAFIYWRYKGGENKKVVTSEAPKLSREPENEDEVEYSSVFLVKKASTPAAIQKDTVENTVYAGINVK